MIASGKECHCYGTRSNAHGHNCLSPAKISWPSVAERLVVLPPATGKRDMPHQAFNVDAIIVLVEYESRALRLRQGTADRVVATREIVAHSRVLIAELDALLGMDAFRMGWPWPPLRDPPASPVPGHPE
jgi:hypothetical protein